MKSCEPLRESFRAASARIVISGLVIPGLKYADIHEVVQAIGGQFLADQKESLFDLIGLAGAYVSLYFFNLGGGELAQDERMNPGSQFRVYAGIHARFVIEVSATPHCSICVSNPHLLLDLFPCSSGCPDPQSFKFSQWKLFFGGNEQEQDQHWLWKIPAIRFFAKQKKLM
jgi:hypothetical protein